MGKTPGDDKNDPSLELPSLSLPGLKRRKRKKPEQSADTTEAQPEPVADTTEAQPEPVADTTEAQPATSRPAPQTVVPPKAEPEPVTPEPVTPEAPTREPEPQAHQPEPQPEREQSPESEPVPAAGPSRRRPRESRGLNAPTLPTLPALPGRVSALVTGLVVGLAGALATWAAMAGCEAVRGVSSCGGAPGFFILVAILVLMVLLGAGLLKMLGTDDAASMSFLAVGVVAVVAMLVMLDVIFAAWMFVVVPVLAALAYLLAHWVTTAFDDEPAQPDWSRADRGHERKP